jgi:predicted aspartyl protease
MRSASFEFPLAYKQTPFGPLSDPRIPLVIRATAGDLTFGFLVDTGADFSVVPRRIADEVGLDWDHLPDATFMGVGNGAARARVGELPLRLGDVEMSVRCLFMDIGLDFFILGRADFLDRFALTIDTRARQIVLTAYS